MNKKAEGFKQYLAEKKIACFQVEELPQDKLNTVAFHSSVEVEGQRLPLVLLLDSSIYGIVRVLVARHALKPENEAELLRSVNALNRRYKAFKYYLDDEGSLVLDSCIMMPVGEANGGLIYTVLDVILRHLQAEYRPLMQKIWR